MADSHFATLVSKDSSANATTNPIYVQATDGTSAIDVSALAVVGGGVEATALRVTLASDSTGTLTVDAAQLDIDNLNKNDDEVLVWANTAKDGTGTDYVPLVDADGHLQVDILSGGGSNASVKVDDAAYTIATDSVTAIGAIADDTATDSVDEGDVGAVRMTLDRKLLTRIVGATDANRLDVDASGNIGVTDAGSSLTVDNSTLAVVGGGTEATAMRVTIANDSTGLLSVDDNGSSLTIDNSTLAVVGGGAEATALRVTIANDSTGVLSIDDNAGSLTVDQGTHDSFNANANIQVADTDVSSSNPVPVTIVDPAATTTEVQDYDTQAALAGSGTDNHDYTVTGTTFLLRSVIAASSGAMKIEVQGGPLASLVTKAVGFIPKQGGVIQLDFNPAFEVPVASTGTVRIIRTNREGGAQDVYSTIIGNDT